MTYKGEPLTEKEVRLFSSGMTLTEDGHKPEKLKPAVLSLLSDSLCRLTLTEGKTHQVKRMLAATGRSVIGLHRERIGCLELDPNQKEGELLALSGQQLDLLLKSLEMK